MSVATLADPEERVRRGGDEIFEFVNGQPVEVDMGVEAEFIGFVLARLLADFVDDHDLGWVFNSKTSYRCFPHDSRLLRIPDASFMPKGRLPDERLPKGVMTVPPDLAVEVVSPNDEAEELEVKIQDYFKAGVKLVWILYPETKTALVRRIDHTAAAIPAEGSLSGEAVVPGFTCALADVFV